MQCSAGYSISVLQVFSPSDLVTPCSDQCSIQLVESIPEGLVYNSSVTHMKTYEAWSSLIQSAEESIQTAGMYWSLRGKDVFEDPSDWAGEDIFKQLETAVSNGVSLKIAQNLPRPGMPDYDTSDLAKLGAQVKSLDFTKLMGAGVLHTKLWLVDGKHFYVGSANFDWRSLTQVKELGVLVKDCPCLAKDMTKIWRVYWDLGGQESIPARWPSTYSTNINSESPLKIPNADTSVYLASSPPPFCPEGRDKDIDAILRLISEAQEFVHIAVMDYFPSTIYGKETMFWPRIDDALREAAITRGVSVRLLASHWAHTRPSMLRYLRSLSDLTGSSPRVDIQVKLFTVPSFTPAQEKIPFARVNHNKYMVTDQEGFIGTSNWSADYFISTGGIGFVFTGPVRQKLQDVFSRDWESDYAAPLQE